MKIYNYMAIHRDGHNVDGSIEAETSADANKALKDMGLFPTSIKMFGPPKKNKYQKPQPEEVKSKVIFTFVIFGFRFTLERA